MTAQLINEAIEKLEAAQEGLRTISGTEEKAWEFLHNSQKHYEIGKAISELKYVLGTL